MRIFIFTEFYPTAYKPYFDTQFAQLIRDGHEIVVFSVGQMGGEVSPLAKRLQMENRIFHYPGSIRDIPRSLSRILPAIACRPTSIKRLARASSRARLLTRFADVARVLSLPRTPPDFCLVHNLSTLVDLPLLRSLYPSTPTALYYHGGEIPRWSRPLDENEVRAVLGAVDLVFTNTEFSRAQIVARGCDLERAVVVPVGFDLTKFQPRAGPTHEAGTLRLVSAGRLSEEKGIRFAIEAIALLRPEERSNISYTIVGDGYERAELEALAESRDVTDTIKFVGGHSADETLRLIGASDVLLLPSVPVGNCVETQACVVQEALLMAIPVIASRIGGVPESIPPVMAEYAVEPGKPEAIRDAIRIFLSMSPTSRARLGYEGRLWAETRYDIRRINALMLASVGRMRRRTLRFV